MKVSSFISRRLSLKSADGRQWSPAIVVAVAGIAVSFAVMMLSIAVVTGFQQEIKRKIMGFDAQITVAPLYSYVGEPSAVTLTDSLRRAVDVAVAEAAGVHPQVALSVAETGVLKSSDEFMGILFRAYGDGHVPTFEQEILTEGTLPSADNPRGIAISDKMAHNLGLAVGDKADAYFIINGTVRPRRFEIVGIYSSGFSDYDELVAFAPYETLSKLQKLAPRQGNRIEINGLSFNDILPAADRLQHALNLGYASGTLAQPLNVSTVVNTGAMYLNWLALLDTNVAVILILMGCVSGFMLVSCVLILILQRVKLVGILKALGATDSQIRGVFMRLGTRVTLTGMAIGNLVSITLIYAEWQWHFLPLDPDSYYLTFVPVVFPVGAWLALNAGVLALSFILMLVPTSVISRMSPVNTMRFE